MKLRVRKPRGAYYRPLDRPNFRTDAYRDSAAPFDFEQPSNPAGARSTPSGPLNQPFLGISQSPVIQSCRTLGKGPRERC
jgi:hypothetical protein